MKSERFALYHDSDRRNSCRGWDGKGEIYEGSMNDIWRGRGELQMLTTAESPEQSRVVIGET